MIERLSKNAGKLNSSGIISETNADMYMHLSISYDTCKYCYYIISWNTVSAFLFLHTTNPNKIRNSVHLPDWSQYELRECILY